MALVPAICTQCGAQIEVDNTHEAGICKHCGTAFITEKAINNYNSYVTNNNIFNGATIIQEDGFQKLLNAANGYLKLDDLSNAMSTFAKITVDYPQKFEGWFGCWCINVKMEKRRYKYIQGIHLQNIHLENAKKLASQEQLVVLKEKYNEYARECELSTKNGVTAFNTRFKTFADFKDYIKEYTLSDGAVFSSSSRIYYKDTELIFVAYHANGYDTMYDRTYNFTITGYDYSANSFVLSPSNVRLIVKAYDEFSLTLTSYFNEKLALKYIQSDGEERILFFHEEKPRYSNNSNNSKNQCYIATCVYGSYDCPEVWTLRRFRDYTLDATWYGRLFIKCYYAISPTLVDWFGNQKWFRTFWKKNLDNMVSKLNQHGIENTKYKDKY